MKKSLLILFLVLVSLVNAQDVQIVRESQDNLLLGEVLNVNININNPENIEKSYEVIETIPHGFELINPSEADSVKQYDAISTKLYKWKITIKPKKILTLNYQIKPENVGEYTLLSTKLIDLTTNDISLGEPKQVFVLCDPDGKCKDDENMINCPEDCSGSVSDGICNYKADGICDPDCEEEPDCKNLSYNKLIYYGFGLLIFLILIIFIFKITKLKKNENFLNSATNQNILKESADAIRSFRISGYNDDQIRQEFLKKGWSNEDLDKIFEYVKNTKNL
jgi:hypothetical protein